MSRDLPKMFAGPVTQTDTSPIVTVGTRRFENGQEYVYMKAGAAIAVNEPVAISTADTTGKTVVKTLAAVTGCVFGVAETAIASASYGWITVRGAASGVVANGVAAGDVLAASGTAGVLAKPANTDIAGQRVTALEANASGGALAKQVFLH